MTVPDNHTRSDFPHTPPMVSEGNFMNSSSKKKLKRSKSKKRSKSAVKLKRSYSKDMSPIKKNIKNWQTKLDSKINKFRANRSHS